METFIQALKGTPWWVYLIFFYLLYVGKNSMKSRVISLKKMFIFPVLLLVWGLYSIIHKFSGFADVLYWIISLTFGCIVGWKLTLRFRVRADKKKHLIKLPGTKMILILSIAIFAVKYCFGYYYATHTQISPFVRFADIVAIGFITGLFIGRVACYLVKFGKARHEKLKESKGWSLPFLK